MQVFREEFKSADQAVAIFDSLRNTECLDRVGRDISKISAARARRRTESVRLGAGVRLVENFLDTPRAEAARQPFVDQFLHRDDLCMAFLIAANEVADILAVIGVAAGSDPGFDPFVLLLGDGDRLARGHGLTKLTMIILLMQYRAFWVPVQTRRGGHCAPKC